MSAVTPASLPLFLQKFSAYHFRVRFEARQAFTFSGKWYFLPRYALGNALKNSSRFSHLYGELFKPHETEDGTNSSSRLIIRVDKPSRRGFSRGEALDIYITIISQDPQLVEDFLTFLPEWQAYNFFNDHSFIYRSYQLFSPEASLYRNGSTIDQARLTINFFVRQAPRWHEHLSLRFLTPTTLKVDQVLKPSRRDAMTLPLKAHHKGPKGSENSCLIFEKHFPSPKSTFLYKSTHYEKQKRRHFFENHSLMIRPQHIFEEMPSLTIITP
ncbi:hypothetical protein [Porphyromonas sp.]|uniref:hypothetical protein n=1 Tax=Porphyromonas sp. TaxID=1924944 RepID=UPI0026DAE090|nr:hypothetical protein [Porphyromonas sp.]MDO4770558.1 hypothetical protein [Porphyromonas sp.]